MRHSFIDAFSEGDSVIHRLDPRVKMAAMTAFLLAIIFTPAADFKSFAIYAIALCALIPVSGIPPLFALRRMLIILPFILMIAAFIPFMGGGEVLCGVTLFGRRLNITREGLSIFRGILVKSPLCVLSMVILAATTRFDSLLEGLELMRIPKIFLMILAFMYRYLFIISDDMMRMARAKASRGAGMPIGREVRTIAGMAGALFIRSYERAERVYLAMCARGFDGTVISTESSGISSRDILFLAAVALCLAAGRLAEWP